MSDSEGVAAMPDKSGKYFDELRAIFDKCCTKCHVSSKDDKNTSLTQVYFSRVNKTAETFLYIDRQGLLRLCDELHISDRADFVISQILHTPDDRLNFESFKVAFLQILPRLLDYSIDETEATFDEEDSADCCDVRIAAFNFDTAAGETIKFDTGSSDFAENLEKTAKSRDRNELQSNDCNNSNHSEKIAHRSPRFYVGNLERRLSVLSGNSSSTLRQTNSSRTLQGSDFGQPLDVDGCGFAQDREKSVQADRSSDQIHIRHILSNLGLAEHGFLVPYDLRILCQHLGLNGLSSQELTQLFNQLDRDGDGRVSVQDFLVVYQCRETFDQNLSNVRNLKNFGDYRGDSNCPADQTNPTEQQLFSSRASPKKISKQQASHDGILLRLLEWLDCTGSGFVTKRDLLNYWTGIGVEDAVHFYNMLQISDHTLSPTSVNLSALNKSIQKKIVEKSEGDRLLQTLVVLLKADIVRLCETLFECRQQANHLTRELQQLNQRNSMLVDEMDQNQQNLEIKSHQQMRDLEEKYQSKILSLEAKYKNEREHWYEEIKDRDELLHRAQKNESESHYKLRQLERENVKFRNEMEDLSQVVQELEGVNSDLRSTLEDLSSIKRRNAPTGDDLSSNILHSTKLSKSCSPSTRKGKNKRKYKNSKFGPIVTPTLRKSLRKQKLLLEESSEFESDPADYMFDRFKNKRPLKKKQRLALVAHRMQSPHTFCDSDGNSSSEPFFSPNVENCETTSLRLRFNDCCTVINTHLNSLEKHLSEEFKFWIKQLRCDVAELEMNFESEKRKIIADYDLKMEQASCRSVEEKRKALENLENNLTKNFDAEKRDLEIKFSSERNIIERKFAEEKMKIMERLQNEFDVELKRIKKLKIFCNAQTSGVQPSADILMSKQKMEKLMQEQVKLQNRIKSLVDELNFVRTRLSVEERENLNCKIYIEQLKKEFALKCVEETKKFSSLVTKSKLDAKLLEDKLTLVKQEKISLKLICDEFKEDKDTQTEEICLEYIEINFEKSSTQKIDEFFMKNNVGNAETSPRLKNALTWPHNAVVSAAVIKSSSPAPFPPTELACEAEAYFACDLQHVDLSLVNFCDRLSRENLSFCARLMESRGLMDNLVEKLRIKCDENAKFYAKAEILCLEMDRLQENHFDSVKIECIKPTLLDLCHALTEPK